MNALLPAFPPSPDDLEPDQGEVKSPRSYDNNSTEEIPDLQTLLIVEDDSSVRAQEAKLLSGHGYRVLEADCAEEALRLAAATGKIHLLLTDFCLPDLDGLELSRRFQTIHSETPVLLISGSVAWLREKLGHLDCSDVLTKPFTFDKLLHKVHTLLYGCHALTNGVGRAS
jgi:DNA-binding response OmpR family regulator